MIRCVTARTIYMMGRAPNSGAPQRVSAHVVPKAQPFPEEEEEKTTIESGWEEEASTTVEQGEVAEKIRALGMDAPRRNNITNVTSTNAGMLDEPTVDDQRANAAISLITPQIQARLMITGGNDAGVELHVTPGKSYTIGRAVDNDIVLTDIAVSRKHFDLRHEQGSWVLVDRGSGNGTLVNNNIEDHPFMLANGDVIEIGNTTFRFEIPNGMPRVVATVDVSMDASMDGTMDLAQHDDEEEEPSTVAGKPIRSDAGMTPSQMPPPREVLVRPKTLPPPAPPMRQRSPSAAPMPSMQASMSYPQPIPSAAATIPSLHQGNSRPMGSPTMLGDSMGMPLPNVMPTTIPGQGPPLAPSQLPPQYHNGYPSSNAQMLVVGGHIPRDATSTALVPPTPYNGMPVLAAQPTYAQPQISRRTKLILAGAGLTLFAAIATVAIIKGSDGGGTNNGGLSEPEKDKDDAKLDAPKTATPGKTIQPIEPPKTITVPPKKDPPGTEPPKTATNPPKVDPPKVDPPKKDPPKVDPPKTLAKVDPPKKDPPKVDPPKKDPPPKKEPKKVAKVDPPPKKDPPPRKEPPKKRVATDTSGVKAKADEQFKGKQFAAAAATLRAAIPSADPDDASDFKSAAAVYDQFGRAYNLGMAPGTSPKEAYGALKKAKNFDPDGVFREEIQSKLAQIAPRAAAGFVAAKMYSAAKEAVATAESAGGSNGTTQSVRSALEAAAGILYKEAIGEMSADPAGAKTKLKEVQQMVDSKSTWYQKAGKALSGSG